MMNSTMRSAIFKRFGNIAAAPAVAGATCTISYLIAEKGSINTCRKFASVSTDTTTKTLLENVAKKKNPSSTGNGPKSFIRWYESHLESKPIPTKMVTGSLLWGLGDVVAQIIPPLLFDEKTDEVAKDSSATVGVLANYDMTRTARAVIFGFVIHAPLSHAHFNFLETMTVRLGLQGMKISVFKTVMEQFVYWSWFSNSLYHGCMGAMQGMDTTQIYNRVSDVLWDTQKAQWIFWIPVQLINFRFVPVRHQLNVVLLTSVVWTALLSAWYPPQEDDKKNKEIEQ